jgi:hypothetical protein
VRFGYSAAFLALGAIAAAALLLFGLAMPETARYRPRPAAAADARAAAAELAE